MQFGFNFMLAHSTDEEARHSTFPFVEGQPDQTLEQWQLHFTDREILNYQLHGHHELPFLMDSKMDWVVGLANTTQDEPDQRFMNYFVNPQGEGQRLVMRRRLFPNIPPAIFVKSKSRV